MKEIYFLGLSVSLFQCLVRQPKENAYRKQSRFHVSEVKSWSKRSIIENLVSWKYFVPAQSRSVGTLNLGLVLKQSMELCYFPVRSKAKKNFFWVQYLPPWKGGTIRKKGSLGDLAVILGSKAVVGSPLPSKRLRVKQVYEEKQRSSSGSNLDAVTRGF